MADDNATTTSDVIQTVNTRLASAEANESTLIDGVRVVVPEEDVGRAFGLFRRNGYDFESKRDPSSENVVFNIEAEFASASEKIATLFE